MAKIIRLFTGALILFAILFLINGFAGKCTKRCGVAYGKHTLESAEGKRFYRIYVKGDSNVGDSVCYTIRYGLFTQSIIEMYNAQKK